MIPNSICFDKRKNHMHAFFQCNLLIWAFNGKSQYSIHRIPFPWPLSFLTQKSASKSDDAPTIAQSSNRKCQSVRFEEIYLFLIFEFQRNFVGVFFPSSISVSQPLECSIPKERARTTDFSFTSTWRRENGGEEMEARKLEERKKNGDKTCSMGTKEERERF